MDISIFKDILKMGRFHFLAGGFLLYSLGALLAIGLGSEADTFRFFFGYLVFCPAHLSVSYSNDLYDMKADSFNTPSPFSGGSGVLQRRPDLEITARVISLSLIAVSLVLAVMFALTYSMPWYFIFLVVFGSLLGWFYTAPPLRLSYRGLGEISTALTVGFLVPFYGLIIMNGVFDPAYLWFVFPFLLTGVSFILDVQLPDREADEKGGKRTLIVRYGRDPAYFGILISFLVSTVYYASLAVLGIGPVGVDIWPFVIFSSVPLLTAVFVSSRRPDDAKNAGKMATLIMSGLFIYLILADLYLLIRF